MKLTMAQRRLLAQGRVIVCDRDTGYVFSAHDDRDQAVQYAVDNDSINQCTILGPLELEEQVKLTDWLARKDAEQAFVDSTKGISNATP